MNNPYTESVSRGAALLDKECPGWRDKVDLSTLDLSDGCFCVLGQIFEYYDVGLLALWGIDISAFGCSEWAASDDFQAVVAHGFSIDYAPPQVAKWQALQEAWARELGIEPGRMT